MVYLCCLLIYKRRIGLLASCHGFRADNFTSGTISGNTASETTGEAFCVNFLSAGMMSDDTARDNTQAGFRVRTPFNQSTVTGNTASGIIEDGFQISFGGVNTGLFNINSSTSNTLKEYNIMGTPVAGGGTNTGSRNEGSNDDF